MYKIYTEKGDDAIYTRVVLYVKKNPVSGAWIRTDKDNAQAVAVAGQLFNLPGKEKLEGFDTAYISDLDVAANLHNVEKLSDQNSDDVNTLLNALCDLGAENAILMDAVLELGDKLADN